MKEKSSEKAQNVDFQLQKTPVAIIGMASIFPNAHNLSEYWDNILKKIDCVTEVPPSRWNIEDYYDPDPSKPDKSYCKRGGFIPDIDFDPTEYGLPPNILEVTDVSQLLGLVVTKDALEDAGYGEDREFNRENTGVILGVVGVSSKLYVPLMSRLQYPVWERVLKASGVSDEDTQKIIEKIKLAYVNWEENSFPGSLPNVVAGRIANRFDLGGTNCVLDAACATSLAAIKMAIMELVERRMDMMLTGGIDTDNSIGVYMSFSKTPAFSKGAAVRTFDTQSDGMMAGEGLGMLVLRRLEDAERDGDRIYAVIRGIGSSSDGRFKSIYAPRPAGQAKAVRRAYAEAGYSPKTVGLIEAHGTGTPAGDPAEFQGLREVFGEENPERQYIALGSVKSQIAHTKGAAGSAGMIKVAMALYHKVLPPTINVVHPNPKLDIENSPFYISTETRPWFRRDAVTPRRAGVSAFGFGGTNFHVALEEYQNEQQGAYRKSRVAQTVLFSAPSPKELLATCQDSYRKMQSPTGQQVFDELASLSSTIQIPLEHARVGFVADSVTEAQELLKTAIDLLEHKPQEETWEHPKGIYYRKTGVDPQGKVVALFSGQGSQYLEMTRELTINFPPMRNAFSNMDALFVKDGLKPISSRVFPPPVFEKEHRDALADTLTQTEHAQPAIGVVSQGLYKILQQAGLTADFVAGHSFGELTALWAAGVLSDADYAFLAKSRGKAMAAPKDGHFDPGTMLAVKGNADRVAEEIKQFPEITLANWNSDEQIVLAGSRPAIQQIQQYLTEKGYSVVPLPVSAAFHTPLVGHAQKPFAEAIDSVTFHAPKIRLFSNTSGKAYSSDPKEIRKVLKGHILQPVLFRDEINAIYKEGGAFFIEFGPKNILTNLVKNILSDRPHFAVALNASAKKDSDRQFRDAVLQLRIAGLNLGQVDPYQAPAVKRAARKLSPVTVKLNGGAYVSPKTSAAFEAALKDGFKISMPASQKQLTSTEIPMNKMTNLPTLSIPAPAVTPGPEAKFETEKPAASINSRNDPAAALQFESNLAQFSEHQSEVVRLHEQYLHNEEASASIFAKLSELEIGLISKADPAIIGQIVTVIEGLERSMARFHDHQAETLRVHQQYLKSQEDFSQTFMQLVQQQIGVGTVPVSRVQTAVVEQPKTEKTLQPTVTFPPANVERFAQQEVIAPVPQLQNRAPLPRIPENGNGAKAAAAVKIENPIAQVVVPVQKNDPQGYSFEQLTKALLKVVSDKTGYPVEMLEMDTDMEADLGIDSIKRVEIMGEMRSQFPGLPKADPEAFAEMRTLGQTVAYMATRKEDTVGVTPPAAQANAVEPITAASSSPASTSPAGNYSQSALAEALLNVVSEKTGYPVEMLEMDTDMEADLGIDSIKRVEIMGEMRNRFPNLPAANPEAFAEMRTLGQTVQYMSGSKAAHTESFADQEANSQVSEPVTVPAVSSAAEETQPVGYDVAILTQALINIVSEKTGYPVEMLDLSNDMESDLGIDSIKRVEIMGEMRNRYPNLPKVDPETFADVRTLGEVIIYLGGSGPEAQPRDEAETAPSAETIDSSIQRGFVSLKSLPEPDFSNFMLPEKHICLITDKGTSATAILAQSLVERGWKVVVLSFPTALVPNQSPLPEGVQRVTLADMSEEDLQQKLDDISTQYGPVGAVIHLNPEGLINQDIFSAEQKEIIKQVFLLAKHLKEPLTRVAKTGKSVFMAVTNLDGEFGLGEKIDFDPISGGLFGLVKTLNLEWEAVFCRAVDITPEMDDNQATASILAELYDPNRLITEVGYSAKGRTTLVVEQPEFGEVRS